MLARAGNGAFSVSILLLKVIQIHREPLLVVLPDVPQQPDLEQGVRPEDPGGHAISNRRAHHALWQLLRDTSPVVAARLRGHEGLCPQRQQDRPRRRRHGLRHPHQPRGALRNNRRSGVRVSGTPPGRLRLSHTQVSR